MAAGRASAAAARAPRVLACTSEWAGVRTRRQAAVAVRHAADRGALRTPRDVAEAARFVGRAEGTWSDDVLRGIRALGEASARLHWSAEDIALLGAHLLHPSVDAAPPLCGLYTAIVNDNVVDIMRTGCPEAIAVFLNATRRGLLDWKQAAPAPPSPSFPEMVVDTTAPANAGKHACGSQLRPSTAVQDVSPPSIANAILEALENADLEAIPPAHFLDLANIAAFRAVYEDAPRLQAVLIRAAHAGDWLATFDDPQLSELFYITMRAFRQAGADSASTVDDAAADDMQSGAEPAVDDGALGTASHAAVGDALAVAALARITHYGTLSWLQLSRVLWGIGRLHTHNPARRDHVVSVLEELEQRLAGAGPHEADGGGVTVGPRGSEGARRRGGDGPTRGPLQELTEKRHIVVGLLQGVLRVQGRRDERWGTGVVRPLLPAVGRSLQVFSSREVVWLATALGGLRYPAKRETLQWLGGELVKILTVRAPRPGEEMGTPAAPRGMQGFTAKQLARMLPTLWRSGLHDAGDRAARNLLTIHSWFEALSPSATAVLATALPGCADKAVRRRVARGILLRALAITHWPTARAATSVVLGLCTLHTGTHRELETLVAAAMAAPAPPQYRTEQLRLLALCVAKARLDPKLLRELVKMAEGGDHGAGDGGTRPALEATPTLSASQC